MALEDLTPEEQIKLLKREIEQMDRLISELILEKHLIKKELGTQIRGCMSLGKYPQANQQSSIH